MNWILILFKNSISKGSNRNGQVLIINDEISISFNNENLMKIKRIMTVLPPIAPNVSQFSDVSPNLAMKIS